MGLFTLAVFFYYMGKLTASCPRECVSNPMVSGLVNMRLSCTDWDNGFKGDSPTLAPDEGMRRVHWQIFVGIEMVHG